MKQTMTTINETKCLLCGSEKHKAYKTIESFGYPVTYSLCQTCGFVFQDQAKTIAKDETFYAETYRKIYQASEEPTPKDLRQQTMRAINQSQFIRANHLAPTRILDIGASSGLLLDTLRADFGAEVMGVEPGNAYRAVAEAREIQMFSSLESLGETNREPFDLITMMHVLEHMPDPLQTLRQIRERLLSSNGALLVEVPNFYAHDSFELAHLSCFTPQSLQEMMRLAGFEIQAFRRHGFPRSKTLNLYIEVLARPLIEPSEDEKARPEWGVSIKRGLSMVWRKLITRLKPKESWLEV